MGEFIKNISAIVLIRIEFLNICQLNSDSGYILAGQQESDAKGYEILITKVEDSGQILYEKLLGSFDSDYIHGLITLSDKKILVVGKKSISAGMSYQSWLFVLHEE